MSTTGHENEAINVQGLKASLQKFKDEYTTDVAYLEEDESSAVIADFDPQTDTVWKKAQTLSNAEKSQVKTNLGLPQEIYSKTEVNELVSTPHQNYVTVATYSELPASGSTDTIYRVSNYDGTQVAAGVYSEYAWNGSDYVFLAAKSSVGEVFDISEYHAGAKYADLAAALGTNGANVPEGVRKGGMSVKYVSNSDNKYVQYRYMGTATTGSPNPFLDTANWQGVDDEPTAGSDNLVESGGVEKKFNGEFESFGYLKNSTTVTGGNDDICLLIPVEEGDKIEADIDNDSTYYKFAFITSENYPTNGSGSITSINLSEKNGYFSVIVPSGAKFAWFSMLRVSTGFHRGVSYVKRNGKYFYPNFVKCKDIDNYIGKINTIKIDETKLIESGAVASLYYGKYVNKGYIDQNGIFVNKTDNCLVIPVSAGDHIVMDINDGSSYYVYAVLRQEFNIEDSSLLLSTADGYTKRIEATGSVDFYIPSDGVQLWVSLDAADNFKRSVKYVLINNIPVFPQLLIDTIGSKIIELINAKINYSSYIKSALQIGCEGDKEITIKNDRTTPTTLVVTVPRRLFVLGDGDTLRTITYSSNASYTQTVNVPHSYVLYFNLVNGELSTGRVTSAGILDKNLF